MNDMLTFKVAGQTVEVVIRPATSAWDAVQVTTTRDAQGYEKGRGDFDVDGLRIFAENLRVAKMIAKRIS